MAGVIIDKFAGVAPQLSKKQLAYSTATVSKNCVFDHGRLDPLKGISDIQALQPATTGVFYYAGQYLEATDVDFVGTLLAQDAWTRISYTDSAYPKIRSGATEYRMGIPAPATAPTVTVDNAGDQSNDFYVTPRAYKVTYVDGFGAEGPPSTASDIVSIGPGGSVTISLPGAPTGEFNFGAGSLKRVYRSNTGSEGTEYQYVGEVAMATGSIVDAVADDELQEVIPSTSWIAPPDDDSDLYPDGPLRGLIATAGGSLVGFSGNSVCVSVPYLLHAWPAEYRFATQYKVIGLVAVQSGVAVLTDSYPYLLLGDTPDGMALGKLEAAQGCKSKESIVDAGDVAVYAGDDGLIGLQGGQASILTGGMITREQWLTDFEPSTIRAFAYEGRYVAFYGDVADNKGFIFDSRSGQASLTMIEGKVHSGEYDFKNDRTLVVYENGAGARRLGAFNEGDTLSYTWRSKIFVLPKAAGFAAVRLEADSYPIAVDIIAEGVTVASMSIPDNKPHRFPGGFIAKRWEIEVRGDKGIDSVGIWDALLEVS